MLTVTEVNVAGGPTGFCSGELRTAPHTATIALGPNIPDTVLIKAIAVGDRRAMELLYARHNVRVYRFALRISGDATAAEDIVSDVFLDVWRQAGRFKERSQVSTWLLAIARNKALATLRRRTEEQLDDDKAATVEDCADDPESVVCKLDRNAVIQKCLSELSAAHREIVDLVYYHEKSAEEAAQIVGIPMSTVKTRMFYARRVLAERLGAAGVDSL